MVACSKDIDQKTRSFHLGFTPFPYDLSAEAIDYVYEKIALDGDIINHHFDDGVPWIEALEHKPFHQRIVDDWAFRKSKTPPDHKVFISVSPLNASRNGLALYRGEEANMPLPDSWQKYSFKDQQVKNAYLSYCKEVIDFFEPDYFCMAIEANLFFANKPEAWADYYGFHKYIYQELKLAYPDLPVFTSVAGGYLLPGFIEGNDHLIQRLATLQLLDYSDYYGVSFYPYVSAFAATSYPEGAIEELFMISQKPLAITETGFAAENFTVTLPNEQRLSVESDEARQQLYLRNLLLACERRKTVFLIHFTLRDSDQYLAKVEAATRQSIVWRDTGLYDEHGQSRPALVTWREFLSRIYQP